jgi:hypothetical protein
MCWPGDIEPDRRRLLLGDEISPNQLTMPRESSMLECAFVLASAERNPYSQYIANDSGGYVHFIGDMA